MRTVRDMDTSLGHDMPRCVIPEIAGALQRTRRPERHFSAADGGGASAHRAESVRERALRLSFKRPRRLHLYAAHGPARPCLRSRTAVSACTQAVRLPCDSAADHVHGREQSVFDLPTFAARHPDDVHRVSAARAGVAVRGRATRMVLAAREIGSAMGARAAARRTRAIRVGCIDRPAAVACRPRRLQSVRLATRVGRWVLDRFQAVAVGEGGCPLDARAAVDGRRRRNHARIPAAAAARLGALRPSYGGLAAGPQIPAGTVARRQLCRARFGCRSRPCSGPAAGAREGPRDAGSQFTASVCGTHPGLRADGSADWSAPCQRSHRARSRHVCRSHADRHAIRCVAVGLHPVVGRPGQRQASSERSGELVRGVATGGAMTRPGCQDRRQFRRS